MFMKFLKTSLLLFLMYTAYGQIPQKMSYHVLINQKEKGVIKNATLQLKTSIRQGSVDADPVFIEIHQTKTSQSGIVSVSIGAGETIIGNLSEIDWSKGNYYITSAADLNGDNVFTEVTHKELLSVPYAFYAQSSATPGPAGKSAYEIWLDQGNIGTVDDFLQSLIGPAGKDASSIFRGANNPPPGFCANVQACASKMNLQGPLGPAGVDGADGLSAMRYGSMMVIRGLKQISWHH